MSCTLVELNCVGVLLKVVGDALAHSTFHVVESTLEVARRLTNAASESKEHRMTEDETCTSSAIVTLYFFSFFFFLLFNNHSLTCYISISIENILLFFTSFARHANRINHQTFNSQRH